MVTEAAKTPNDYEPAIRPKELHGQPGSSPGYIQADDGWGRVRPAAIGPGPERDVESRARDVTRDVRCPVGVFSRRFSQLARVVCPFGGFCTRL